MMSDLTSRLSDLRSQYSCFNESERDAYHTLSEAIKALQERKIGKWLVYYECPKCGEITKDFTEYCPFCNADMRGEDNV